MYYILVCEPNHYNFKAASSKAHGTLDIKDDSDSRLTKLENVDIIVPNLSLDNVAVFM